MTITLSMTLRQAQIVASVLRTKRTQREEQRARLIIEGATDGALHAAAEAIRALDELQLLFDREVPQPDSQVIAMIATGDADDRAAVEAAILASTGAPFKLVTDGKTIRTVPGGSGRIIGEEEAELQRALGAGPLPPPIDEALGWPIVKLDGDTVIDPNGHRVMLRSFQFNAAPRDGGFVLRSDWGERGEKDEQP